LIPRFNTKGTLPPGIHESTIEEFEERFAITNIRKRMFKGLLALIMDLKRIGCRTIYIDGSYVTNKPIPGDIDVCWDDNGIEYPYALLMLPILFADLKDQRRKYDCEIFQAYDKVIGKSMRFIDFFQIDIYSQPKGIIKINI